MTDLSQGSAQAAAPTDKHRRDMLALLRDPRFTMSGGTEFALEIVAALSGAAPIPQPELTDELWAVDRGADLLEHYAAFIHRVKPDEIEEHPYLPELEQVAKDLRSLSKVRPLLAASPAQEAQQPSSEKPALQVGANAVPSLLEAARKVVNTRHLEFWRDARIDAMRDLVAALKLVDGDGRAALSSPASTEGALQGSGHAPATDGGQQ